MPASPDAAAPADQPAAQRARGGGATVRTAAGRIVGERTEHLCVFRGVPYAAAPVGELRFASPRPPRPWRGVRDTTTFGAPALQPGYLPDSSEDCLYANVWTPGVEGRRPVLVYVHGGGWFLGGSNEPDYDGAHLATRGDVVVVTFNYRLGVLGWGLHEALRDPATGTFANWGLQDQAMLLRWVHENAAAFGGDPENITVAGTSAGGASVWQLSLAPELRDVIARTVLISVKHPWAPADSTGPEESRAVFERLARDLGTTVPGLRSVAADALTDAWEALFAPEPWDRPVEGWRGLRGPVPDGHVVRGHHHELPTPSVPMMVIYCRTEGSFFTTGPGAPSPDPLPVDEAGLRAAVRRVLLDGAAEVTDAEVERCIEAYRASARGEGLPTDPVSLWTEIWGDGMFRYPIVRFAERHAREGHSPQYVMEFAHPVHTPHAGTPHEATSKFLFGSYPSPANATSFGAGALEETISDTLIDLVASFARDGAPRSPHAPAWPVFAPDRPTTLSLGGPTVAVVGPTPKAQQLRHWDTAGWVPHP